uniref:Uncharacterized protein n=1 Tax=Tanacetum cinerariifolium TaxID=118510 RepID=A0A699J4K0_TANCI|nr:hypothetical protein [Tanacetum cinerariifolium]
MTSCDLLHQLDHYLFGKLEQRFQYQVLIIELVMHTEKNDTVFHTKNTRMLILVVEIDVGGMTADVVDKMIDNHSKDRSVKEVLMMVLMMHTEEDDTVLHIEKSGMLMLVVEIDVGAMTADVVDKLNCSSDDVQPRQVDLSLLEWLLLVIIQSISLTGSLHSLQQMARGVDHSKQILESFVHVVGSTYTAPFGSSMSHTYPSPASMDGYQHPTKSLYRQDLAF